MGQLMTALSALTKDGKTQDRIQMEQDYRKSLDNLYKNLQGIPPVKLPSYHANSTKLTLTLKNEIDNACKQMDVLIKDTKSLAKEFNDPLKKINFRAHEGEVKEWQSKYKKGIRKSNQTKDFTTLMGLLKKYQAVPSQYKENKNGEIECNNYKNGYLHQICTQIGEIVRSVDPAKALLVKNKINETLTKDRQLSGNYSIRNRHKKGIRILTKGVQKYQMDFSKIQDGFGLEIITKDYEHHIEVLRTIFREFGEKPKILEVRGSRKWKVQVLCAKFGLSDPKQTKNVRYKYADDKIIWKAITPWGEEIDLEGICILVDHKPLKKKSHVVYDTVREAGANIAEKLCQVGAQEIHQKCKNDLKVKTTKPLFRRMQATGADFRSSTIDIAATRDLTLNKSNTPRIDFVKSDTTPEKRGQSTPPPMSSQGIMEFLKTATPVDAPIIRKLEQIANENIQKEKKKILMETGEYKDRMEKASSNIKKTRYTFTVLNAIGVFKQKPVFSTTFEELRRAIYTHRSREKTLKTLSCSIRQGRQQSNINEGSQGSTRDYSPRRVRPRSTSPSFARGGTMSCSPGRVSRPRTVSPATCTKRNRGFSPPRNRRA